MSRNSCLLAARVLFNECSKKENPEYLRAMVELIALSYPSEIDGDEYRQMIEDCIVDSKLL